MAEPISDGQVKLGEQAAAALGGAGVVGVWWVGRVRLGRCGGGNSVDERVKGVSNGGRWAKVESNAVWRVGRGKSNNK